MIPRRAGSSRLRVPLHWIRLWPTRGHNLRFWVQVAKLVKERGVRKKDEEAVTNICAEVEYQWTLTSKS